MNWKTAVRFGVSCVVFAALFVANNEIFGGNFGPPSSVDTDAGTPVSVGVGYFYYQGEWSPGSDWKDGGYVMKSDDSSVRQNRFFLQTSFRFTEDWEGFMRMGGADIKASDAMTGGENNFSDSCQFYTSLGVKGLVYEMPQHHIIRIGFGPFLTASWHSGYKDSEDVRFQGVSGKETLEYKDPWEINLGVAAQVKFTDMNDLLFYGGPFYYYSRAKAKLSFKGGGLDLSDTVKVKEKRNIGGFAGLRLPIADAVNFNIETQFKSDFSAGAYLSYSF